MVAWVKPGDDFIIETYDWTGGFIKNNDSADDVRDIDLSIVHFLSGPIGVKGAEPGDLLVVDLLDVGPLKESLWGFNGFFSKTERRRLPHRSFPAGAEVDLGHQGPLHLVAPHSRREFRRPDPSRPDRLSARSETAGDLERARERADRDQSDPRAGPRQSAVRRDRACRPAPRATPRPRSARRAPAPCRRASMAATATSRICRAARRSIFPVYVPGGGLSMGDLHFSQGDGEITFCGAIEMAGWLHIKVDIIKDGVAKYGIKNPVFKPSPITPNYKDYLIFEGISVDEDGKQHYLDVHIAYRQACLNAIEYLKKFGYSGAQAYSILGTAPCQGHISRRRRRAERLRHAVAADGDLRLRHHAVVGGSDQTHHGRHPDADLAGQVIPAREGCGTACVPAAPHPPSVAFSSEVGTGSRKKTRQK